MWPLHCVYCNQHHVVVILENYGINVRVYKNKPKIVGKLVISLKVGFLATNQNSL
jgi:hypothetical protein